MAAKTRTEKYLTRADICERYSISRWTLGRLVKQDKDFPTPLVLNKRDYFSEYEIEKWEATRGRPDPDLEGRIQGLKPVSSVITDYGQMVDALTKRRADLGISSIELDARSGMQEGYTSKLENFGRPQGRGMGPETFPLWLGGLRVGIVLVDLPRRPRKVKDAA